MRAEKRRAAWQALQGLQPLVPPKVLGPLSDFSFGREKEKEKSTRPPYPFLSRNLAKGAQQGTHKSKRTLTSCIINELNKAAAGDVTSFAVSKKEELERIAASAR